MKKDKSRLRRVMFLVVAISLHGILMAQTKTITGVVEDASGEVIIGASILAKGTKTGTITDSNGKFILSTQANVKTITVSYIGMVSKDVEVTGSSLKIKLEDNDKVLDELVVIGYGNVIRKDLTGSVGSVSGAALATIPVGSAAEALPGKIAGVQVTTADGAPGSEVNIRIRGGASVTQSNAPLFIVDGFPVSNINDIPATDIQSIDVLKDASVTAIYGAKGGNGVVIVTTKSAKSGKLSIKFNHLTQVRQLARKIDVMDPYEFVKIQYESVVSNSTNRQKFRGNFGAPTDFDLYKRYEGNDWQDEILGGNPISNMTNLTLGGGSETVNFNTSITNNDEKGVLVGTGVIRTSVNTKISANLSKKFKILLNPRFSYRQDNGPSADKIGGGGIIDVLRYRPTNGLRDFGFIPQVDPDEERIFQYSNPKGDMDQNYTKKNKYEFTNQASIEWNILPNLIFHSNGTQYMSFYNQNLFYGDLTSQGRANNNLPVAEIIDERQNSYGFSNTLNYSKSIGRNNISILAGQEVHHSVTFASDNSARYFPKAIKPVIAIRNMGLGVPYNVTSSISSPLRTLSYFGQSNYNYDHRYFLSLTFRADASTKFAPGKQWGYFPAISGAWELTQEKFMADQHLFSQLKLRAAVGKSGNDGIADDMWRQQFVITSSGGPGWGEVNQSGYEYYSNAGGNTFPNPNIKWESNLTRNLAMDFSLFNGRLTITPEVYMNTTTDMLYTSQINTVSGYGTQTQNIGQVTTRGYELTINAKIVETKNAFLSANFTIGRAKKIVDKLNGTDNQIWLNSSRWSSSVPDYVLEVGKEVGLIYGYVNDGIYGFNEFQPTLSYNYTKLPGTVNCDALFGTAPGKPKFKNMVDGVDGSDDVNIVNANDRVVIGNTNPKVGGGFGLSGGWNGFDFTANFTYLYGFDVNNATRYQLSSFEGNTNKYYNVLPEFNSDKRWQYAESTFGDQMVGDSRYVQKYQEVNANATTFNPIDITKKVTMSNFIEDGSFLRLQDLTFGYTLPERIVKHVGLSSLRVFVQGYNLWLLTKYTGYDPEVDVQTGLTPGVDYNRYPRSRNLSLGLNVTF
jgi:TonB-dependent starch-binding outer membrane protein SusC